MIKFRLPSGPLMMRGVELELNNVKSFGDFIEEIKKYDGEHPSVKNLRESFRQGDIMNNYTISINVNGTKLVNGISLTNINDPIFTEGSTITIAFTTSNKSNGSNFFEMLEKAEEAKKPSYFNPFQKSNIVVTDLEEKTIQIKVTDLEEKPEILSDEIYVDLYEGSDIVDFQCPYCNAITTLHIHQD